MDTLRRKSVVEFTVGDMDIIMFAFKPKYTKQK